MNSFLMFALILVPSFAEPPVNNQPQQYVRNQLLQNQRPQYGPPGYTPGQPVGLPCPATNSRFNKEFVKHVYQEVIGDHNLENLDKYFHADYIQHSPDVADGIEGLRAYLTGPLGNSQPTKLDIKRVAADDDLVWLHTRFPEGDTAYSVVDIFRVECGKIKEHWDVSQETKLTMPSANPHPFF